MKRFPKEYKDLIEVAEECGWTVSWTSRSHIKFTPPPNSPWPAYFTSGTPSDHRVIKNCRAFLKRCEVDSKR
jgi:hypothetical protein